MNLADPIAAIASVPRICSRIVVRTSGAGVIEIARSLAGLESIQGGVHRVNLVLEQAQPARVPASLWVFVGPRSASGEDAVEYHLPGHPIIARWVMDELLQRGCRLAEPGEFTARGFFNGRLDMTQAEGVAATIAASSGAQLDAARRLMAGELAQRLAPMLDELTQTLALVEVGIDFTDQDVSFIEPQVLRDRIRGIDAALARLLDESVRFERLNHDPRVVMTGWPNAGKSTLLNALAGSTRAVVSEVAGTTRDVISARVKLPGGWIELIDAAGIEPLAKTEGRGHRAEDEERSDSASLPSALPPSPLTKIHSLMQTRARQAIERADVLVMVHAIDDDRPMPVVDREVDFVVRSKCDLRAPDSSLADQLRISVHSRAGLDQFIARLNDRCFGQSSSQAESTLALNARHVHEIASARDALARADHVIEAGDELIAAELRGALESLGRILGTVSPDDVLGRVFSGFCIGK